MTQTWHADEETLRTWATGSAAPLLAASVEAHLLRCEECRRRTSSLSVRTTPDDAVRRWDALADHIDRPRSNPLLRLGLATPGLRTAWLTSILLLLTLPVVVSVLGLRLPVFMALAPVAPLAAVALTYGRHAEPAGELALATPTAGLRVVAAPGSSQPKATGVGSPSSRATPTPMGTAGSATSTARAATTRRPAVGVARASSPAGSAWRP